jgi:HEAT repeats
VALTKLDFDSSAIPKTQSSANVIVALPGNIDAAPSQTCRDDSLGVKPLDEATRTVRDLLAGRTQKSEIVSSTDKSIRKAVAGELLASLSRPDIEEREQARRLFIDHGYLDDAMQELGTAELPDERAMAARALGLIGSPRGIMSLVNALLDDAPEVRHASEQALTQISGPVVADLGALLEEELNFEAAEVVESSPTTVAFQETSFQNLTIEERMLEKPMSQATEVTASTISLEEQVVQKAMRELKS